MSRGRESGSLCSPTTGGSLGPRLSTNRFSRRPGPGPRASARLVAVRFWVWTEIQTGGTGEAPGEQDHPKDVDPRARLLDSLLQPGLAPSVQWGLDPGRPEILLQAWLS